MLKNISPILRHKMLEILCEMGGGDELVAVDGNFSATSNTQNIKFHKIQSSTFYEKTKKLML